VIQKRQVEPEHAGIAAQLAALSLVIGKLIIFNHYVLASY
jgi:hypothetical protein